MREILFRGKSEENGKWVEGGAVQPDDPFVGNKSFIADIKTVVTEDGYFECMPAYVIVKPETIGQCISLRDLSGSKIFEGDILRDIEDGTLYVVDGSTPFGFDVRVPFDEEPNTYLTFFDIGIDRETMVVTGAVVIGNIHDNPELLEVE